MPAFEILTSFAAAALVFACFLAFACFPGPASRHTTAQTMSRGPAAGRRGNGSILVGPGFKPTTERG